ncbi:MAG: DUF4198 domain-containing protein [Desulfovibrio sp.]|jgi:hypothetical protein|nr:DUF4198 domain-containing protein [Desulfovibrio sp.]
MLQSFFAVMRRRAPKHFCLLALCAALGAACAAQAQVTLLVPDRAVVDAPAIEPAKAGTARDKTAPGRDGKAQPAPDAKNVGQKAAGETPAAQKAENGPAGIGEEVDLLITRMQPFTLNCLVMDMPELFAVLRYDDTMPVSNGVLRGERLDLLGDLEEIRYLDKKAWAANVALDKPGLYQFSIDSRPWWDVRRDRFVQHYVKTMLPVYGVERGWDTPAGQRFEIQPLVRPFGLTAPALFSGRALLNGEPLRGAAVRLARVNTNKSVAPTRWHEELASISDAAGQFAFVVNQPGWWCCMALTPGDPLKGPDGAPRPLELGALFWFYVDAPTENGKR